MEKLFYFSMNDLPPIGLLCHAQRPPGPPGGKHRKPPEGNARRKAAPTPKKTTPEGVRRPFAATPSEMDPDHAGTWEAQASACTTPKRATKSTDKRVARERFIDAFIVKFTPRNALETSQK